MTEVVASIKRVTDIMGEIAAASQEQSAGVAQVGEAVTQMDRATQQNAALVEQSAAAADSLKAQAHQLVESVAVFRLQGPAAGVGSTLSARTAVPAPVKPAAKSVAAPVPASRVVKAEFKPRTMAAPEKASQTPPLSPAVSQKKQATASANAGSDDWETF
jgi:uncharacterized phage infection (PIP) family protein YhgE